MTMAPEQVAAGLPKLQSTYAIIDVMRGIKALAERDNSEWTTTLSAIRKHRPCEGGWKKLLAYLGKTKADDDPLPLRVILESNGLDDALWCLRAVEGHDREIRLFAVWCARQVQHLMRDQRSLDAIDVAERYANGLASDDELRAARAAARAAAGVAAGVAAWVAARVAAGVAARVAQRVKFLEMVGGEDG